MHTLNLTESEFERLLKVFGCLTAALFAGIFVFQVQAMGTPTFTAMWRSFSAALTVATLLFGVFYRVAWRSPRIAKWMRRPIVHGVWRGILRSDYGGNKENPLELPIVFVVRQTYLSLSLESFTQSQEGVSKLEALVQNSRTESTRLSYVFELRREYRGENKLTVGAGELRLLDEGTVLRGFYWTNSPTHGELQLKLVSRDCDGVDCYEVAERRWPASQSKVTLP